MVTGVNGWIGIFPTLSLRSGRGRSAAAGCGRRGCLVVDEPEADVARSHAGVAALSRRGAIALAIIGRAQIAAALHGARRHAGAIGVIGVIRVGAGWIVGVGGVVAGAEEIGRHLPHIADHVVEAVRVGLVTADRRDALEAVGFGIVVGKSALPAVRQIGRAHV